MSHDVDPALELGLRGLFEVPVPASVDDRVAAAIADRRATGPIHRRRTLTPARVLLAAALVTTLAVTVAAEPIRELFSGWGTSFDLVYDVSTVIDQSVTVDGYRMTVVRAYADTGTVRLAILTEDTQDRGATGLLAGEAVVTDDTGMVFPPFMSAYGHPDERRSETWLRYRIPEPGVSAGIHHLTVEVPDLVVERGDRSRSALDRVLGPWIFTFDLPFHPVLTAHPGTNDTASGVTVTFVELGVSPATTTGRLRIEGLPDRPVDWAWDPELTVFHDCTELDIDMLSPGSVLDGFEFEAYPGATSLAGTWTITIDRFHRDIPDPKRNVTSESEIIRGPWVLRFHGAADQDPDATPAPAGPPICVSPDRPASGLASPAAREPGD